MGLIETIKNLCHECYACVRNCPVNAVRVSNGQAEVLEERCIHCGNCVKICAQNAKEVQNFTPKVKELLENAERVVVGLAPTFPAYDPELSLNHWISYLEKLGFKKVYEIAWGAQLIIEEYKKLLHSHHRELLISTPCPVIVNLIEKYYPTLVPYLVPIVSPMSALARYIEKIEPQNTKIVLIGPCLAKKKEVEREPIIDAVLTFSELFDLGKEILGTEQDIRKINLPSQQKNKQRQLSENPSDLYVDQASRKIPLAGGLLAGVTNALQIKDDGYLNVEGSDQIFELLDSLVKGEITPDFLDLLYCEGCINGVDLTHGSYFKKEKAVKNFIENSDHDCLNLGTYSSDLARQMDLSTSFSENYKTLPQPTEKDIWFILNLTNKFTNDDLLNCGACGYNSCREKAIAVYQGIAEVEMCLPYLLTEKRQEIKKVQSLNEQLDTLINSSYDGMVVVNNSGEIERINQSYAEIIDLAPEGLIGVNVKELEERGIIFPIVSLLAIKEKRQITLVQNTYHGKRILASANPILDENQEVLRILVNARDICKLNELEMRAEERKRICKYLENREGINSDEETNQIVFNSAVMKNILKLAEKIAQTSSTVLITGESGVGKEVIARYIHQQSGRQNNFVKINCGAIPETLLESELFGYETGAFSGAKREGKPGFIEMAHQGTLFLDEIGEMPLNLQVKLLQVLQEHRITRLGGIEQIDVDFRLITATNRDLMKMIAEKLFRQDLYYRLNVVPIFIPGLRDRKEDVRPLINYWLKKNNLNHNKVIKLTTDAETVLLNYHWPGNVRELANFIERIVVTTEERIVNAERINQLFKLKESDKSKIIINEILPLEEAVKEVERKLLLLAKENSKSTYEMAELLGVNQSTIVRKLNKYFLKDSCD